MTKGLLSILSIIAILNSLDTLYLSKYSSSGISKDSTTLPELTKTHTIDYTSYKRLKHSKVRKSNIKLLKLEILM